MRHSRTILGMIAVVAFFSGGGMARAMTLDEALEILKTHRFGQNSQALNFLHETAVTSHSDPALRKKFNDGLVRILDSDAAYDAKQFACRQLALTATEEHIPALARQLGDEKMTHMALYVLTHIDSPEVDKVLLSALDTTAGNARLGIINMLGNRRCESGAEKLSRLAISDDEDTSIAAIRALGRIGTIVARRGVFFNDIIYNPPKKYSHAKEMALAAAELDFADRLLAVENRHAHERYLSVFQRDYPAHVRAAALRVLVTMVGRQSQYVSQALASDDKQLYGMAATIVRTVPEREAADTFVAGLARLKPNVQVMLINALAARNDGAGVAVVRSACDNSNALVKQAAIRALGRINVVSNVPILITQAAHEAHQGAALESLTNMAGEKVNAVLVERLEDSDDSEKAIICQVLRRRNAVETAQTLVKVAENENTIVRTEAINALHELAGPSQISALVDLIFIVEPAEVDLVGKALSAVARRHSMHQKCTQDILSKYDHSANADQRASLLTALGGLGHEQALPKIRQALQDGNNQLRYAAIKALSDWPDAAPSGDLLNIAELSDNHTHRVLALRGFIDLINAAALPVDHKLAHYRRAMQLARQDTERKKVLSVLSDLDTLEAFRMAMSHLDNPSLKNESALAACMIAQQIYAAKGRQLKNDLERIATIDIADSTKQQAREILGNIAKVTFYVTDWEVSGPYVQKGKDHAALFDIAFAPETNSGKNAKWRRIPGGTDPAQPGYVDLLKALNGGEQRVAYLRATVEWPTEQPVTLRIGSDDGIKVWVNGRLVHANNVARGFAPDQDSATATFKKGENSILMKITQNNMPWGASLRVEKLEP